MASCKDCMHYDVCEARIAADENYPERNYTENNNCSNFKDRTRFVELPCKVGEEIYEMVLTRDKSFSHWNTHKVVGVHLGNFPDLRGHKRQEYLVTHCEVMNLLNRIPLNKLGKTVFLTRVEAEKALEEQDSNVNK